MREKNNTDLRDRFPELFSVAAEGVFSAPGRVNLIGEHTDYNDGFVLPIAIDFYTHVAVQKRDDDILSAVALDYQQERIQFSLKSDITHSGGTHWSNYLKGVVRESRKKGLNFSGANLLISGDIPQGTGLSSSASLEIALLSALCHIAAINLSGEDAARIGQAAENNFVGCNCGIMDQLASALCERGKAMLLDCRSLTRKMVSIPEDLCLMVVNSNVRRGLVESEYNTRRRQCEQAAAHFKLPALRDLSLAQLLEEKNRLDPLVFSRAHHVVSENTRTLAAAEALQEGDIATLGRLMQASHFSMQKDFEISVPAIDCLVSIVKKIIGSEGGVRMTGGGFGGCCIAVFPQAREEKVRRAIQEHYASQTGLTADIYAVTTCDGGFVSVAG